MMSAAEQTRRLTLTPYLVAAIEIGDKPAIRITNAAAPAVRCEIWFQVTDPGQRLDQGLPFRRPPSISITKRVEIISQDKPFSIPMAYVEPDAEMVYVVDCFDTADGSYQLQILQKPMGRDFFDIQTAFSIPDTHHPLWKQLRNRLAQRWLLRSATKKKQ
jgi:hypothetical protein